MDWVGWSGEGRQYEFIETSSQLRLNFSIRARLSDTVSVANKTDKALSMSCCKVLTFGKRAFCKPSFEREGLVQFDEYT